jgi:lysosomal alpha-mannosidase
VTVNFHSDLNNNQVFYTDSNGLEMQKRILNYRPTWNLTILEGGLNITANYYPINNAITIIDETTNTQMTVMNDRSQGGSVLVDGRVELMQNRRNCGNDDDGRGVGQPLNEKGPLGYGITVPATYYVQLFNRLRRTPLQRQIQQVIDAPV